MTRFTTSIVASSTEHIPQIRELAAHFGIQLGGLEPDAPVVVLYEGHPCIQTPGCPGTYIRQGSAAAGEQFVRARYKCTTCGAKAKHQTEVRKRGVTNKRKRRKKSATEKHES